MPLVRLSPVLVLLASMVSAASPQPTPLDHQPGPGIIQYAATHHIPLEGVELASAGEPARPGDLLVVLFTIEESAATRQWITEFRTVGLSEREARSKPDSGQGLLAAFQSSLKTDTGHEFSFAQAPAALEMRTIGPFAGDAPAGPETPTPVTARVLATRGYLEHGLAPMGEIELRLRAAGKRNPGLSYMYRAGFSAEQTAAAKIRAQEAGFTEKDERAFAHGIFALMQFGHLGFLTQGIDRITREVADSPTLFSGAFTNIDWNGLQLVDGRDWGLPDRQVFRVPYRFISKTKARGNLYFTAAHPPLQNTAGIIGLTVDETSKAPGKRLLMRVLAGRRAREQPGR